MKFVRALGFILLGLVVLIAIAACVGYTRFTARRDAKHATPSFVVATLDDAETLERGEHIARTIGGCAECHGGDFGGAIMSDDAMLLLAAPNLTRGKGSVTRDYHGDDWVRAIAYGVHHDGRPLLVMPSDELGKLADSDLAAVASYLAQVPPVDREMPQSHASPLGTAMLGLLNAPVFPAELAGNRQAPAHPPEVGATRVYGEYLLAVCHGCHGADLKGGITTSPGSPPSTDISQSAMAAWTFDELEKALRQGQRRSGGTIKPQDMPWGITMRFTPDEMRALWLAMRGEEQ